MRCDICNAIFNNEAERDEHLKLHANKSNNKTSVSDKSDDDVTKGKLECSFCKLYVSSAESMKIHELGHNHKRKVMLYERNKKAEEKCGIYVTGFKNRPSNKETLDYFATYGNVVWFSVNRYSIRVDFEDPESAKEFINTDHYLDGQLLKVSYRQAKIDNKKKFKEIEEPTIDLESHITNITDLGEQFAIVRNILWDSHREQTVVKQWTLLKDIEMSVSSLGPKVEIYMFGSSITGLNFPTSDVDIYISNVIKVKDKKQVSQLYRIRSLLFKSTRFKDIIVIASANTPIIKCTHEPTELKCDINIKNQLGVCNSLLIKNILSIDVKLRDTMLFLKYFFRIHGFTGQCYFNNYAICIMFIFYLQILNKLPPIAELNKDPHYKNIQDGWNGGLDPFNPNDYQQHFEEMTYLDLLKGFFQFYAEFKYETNAACPFLGLIINKDDLVDPNKLPNTFTYYKDGLQNELIPPLKITNICVQDPFEHNRNITGIIKSDLLSRFVELCQLAYGICEEGEETLLLKLVTMKIPLKIEKPITASFSAIFTLTMGSDLKYLDEEGPAVEAWFKVVCKFTKIVLEDFLKFEISEEAAETESKSKNSKLSNQKDVHDQPKKLTLNCSTKMNLWAGRQSIPKNLSKKLVDYNFMESESIITESLCGEIGDQNRELLISFKLLIENKTGENTACFFIEPIYSYRKTLKSFKKFFATKMPLWFISYQKYLTKLRENTNGDS